MKDLLAIITSRSGKALSEPGTYSLGLAAHMRSHVTAIIAEIEPFNPTAHLEPDNMQGDSRPVPSPTLAERLGQTAELVRSEARRAKVSVTILEHADSNPYPLREIAISSAQVRDLSIVGVYGPLIYPRQGLVEAILFGSGRPVLLVPPGAPAFSGRMIVVGWDATRSATRALHDALPFLATARKVVIISLSDNKVFRLPESGPEVCRYLERWGIDASFEAPKQKQNNIGNELLLHAKRLEADLLVMGGFGHAREREFLFGSATRDIFQSNLELPVLMSH
jgi:nucleotide-binding universal stress UspA family protein